MSHTHYCDVEAHEWVCNETTCECICGDLMEGGDHGDCPGELRACPEHQEEQRQPEASDSNGKVLP